MIEMALAFVMFAGMILVWAFAPAHPSEAATPETATSTVRREATA